jgi:hypothetical protein
MSAKSGRLPDNIRVMPGLVPGIHAVTYRGDFQTPPRLSSLAALQTGTFDTRPDVDGRDKPGHDGTLAPMTLFPLQLTSQINFDDALISAHLVE